MGRMMERGIERVIEEGWEEEGGIEWGRGIVEKSWYILQNHFRTNLRPLVKPVEQNFQIA
jgi:hypothetical protein